MVLQRILLTYKINKGYLKKLQVLIYATGKKQTPIALATRAGKSSDRRRRSAAAYDSYCRVLRFCVDMSILGVPYFKRRSR